MNQHMHQIAHLRVQYEYAVIRDVEWVFWNAVEYVARSASARDLLAIADSNEHFSMLIIWKVGKAMLNGTTPDVDERDFWAAVRYICDDYAVAA